jgi:hypothetical protein
MYAVKISGTKLSCVLENESGQWMLRIKLEEITEAEMAVTRFDRKNLLSNLESLLEDINININDFQIKLIHKDLVSQIAHLLSQDPDDKTAMDVGDAAAVDDPRFGQLLSKITKLEKTISELEARISRIEGMMG